MLFRVNTSMNKFYVFGLALLFTVALAGCGGGGGKKKAATGPSTETCPAGQIGTPPNCTTPAPVRDVANATSVMAKATAIMALEPDAAASPAKEFGAEEGPFDAADNAAGEDRNYVVAVDASDGSVTVTDRMGAVDAPADDNDDMKLMHMGGAPHGDQGDDWAGSMFARDNMDDDDMVTSTEKVIVYTDVEDPLATAFAMVRNVVR